MHAYIDVYKDQIMLIYIFICLIFNVAIYMVYMSYEDTIIIQIFLLQNDISLHKHTYNIVKLLYILKMF